MQDSHSALSPKNPGWQTHLWPPSCEFEFAGHWPGEAVPPTQNWPSGHGEQSVPSRKNPSLHSQLIARGEAGTELGWHVCGWASPPGHALFAGQAAQAPLFGPVKPALHLHAVLSELGIALSLQVMTAPASPPGQALLAGHLSPSEVGPAFVMA